jgi:hypothetical protein
MENDNQDDELKEDQILTEDTNKDDEEACDCDHCHGCCSCGFDDEEEEIEK